jgi:hypothetical protein
VPLKLKDKTVRPFVKVLIAKICEHNYRAQDKSRKRLMQMFGSPGVEIRHVIEGIMDITEGPPGPEKTTGRQVQARLEILQQVLVQYGIDDRVWNWQVVF